LWFVRHGETTGGSSSRYYGATDVPLSDLGRAQVGRLRGVVAACKFSALVHSPLSRAVESARIVQELLALAPAVVEAEERLREVDFGELEGLTAAEIEARFPGFFAEWRAGRTEGYPGGETSLGFRRRVADALDSILARHAEGDLLLVVHRGVIKAALVHLLSLSWAQVRPWSLDLGSATVVIASGDGAFTLERYNVVGA